MKKKFCFYIFLVLGIIASALLIFFFSAQGSEASNQSSEGLVQAVISIFHPDYSSLSKDEQTNIYQQVYFLVRKAAHFTEFALLGFLLRMLICFHNCRFQGLLTWLLGTLYGGTDELHQYFTGDRTASFRDVAIDSTGVLFGCLLAAYFIFLYSRKKQKKIQ